MHGFNVPFKSGLNQVSLSQESNEKKTNREKQKSPDGHRNPYRSVRPELQSFGVCYAVCFRVGLHITHGDLSVLSTSMTAEDKIFRTQRFSISSKMGDTIFARRRQL